jgi:colanic acid biosynthesis glycosyl transferase WcaI
MRTLIYSANFAPEKIGIGKYSGEMGAWLVAQGHQVRAVAAPPYYPNWKVDAGYSSTRYRREKWQGIDIIRAPIWVPKFPTGLRRVLHLFSFAVASFPVMLAQVLWRPQIVIVVAPAFMCAPAAWLTARLCGAQAWLHVQDFEIDCAFEMGLLKGAFLRRLVTGLERFIFRRFDCVSTISRRMLERVVTKGVPPNRTRLFLNWVDLKHVKPLAGANRYRAELGIASDKVVVLFSGALGAKQGLMVIPQVASVMRARTDVVFVICGEGVMRIALEKAVTDLPNLRLLPLQPYERLGELLAMADIQLLPQSPGAADLFLPSKLSGMLASGRPIIATCDAGTELHAVVSRCGAVVPPGDEAALCQIICKFADDEELRRELGLQARAYAEAHLGRDAVLGKVFGRRLEDEVAEPANDWGGHPNHDAALGNVFAEQLEGDVADLQRMPQPDLQMAAMNGGAARS